MFDVVSAARPGRAAECGTGYSDTGELPHGHWCTLWSECCRFTVHGPLNLQLCRTNAILRQQAMIQERRTGSKAESSSFPQQRGLYVLMGTYRGPVRPSFSVPLPILTSIYRGNFVSSLRLHGLAKSTYWVLPYCCFIIFSAWRFDL
jgi:hypothetical protein